MLLSEQRPGKACIEKEALPQQRRVWIIRPTIADVGGYPWERVW